MLIQADYRIHDDFKSSRIDSEVDSTVVRVDFQKDDNDVHLIRLIIEKLI